MSDNPKLDQLTSLIDSFRKVPRRPVRGPTYLEIAGFPHYENVISNLLAFFFYSDGPHGLKDLLYQSLMACLQEDESSVLGVEHVTAERELPTDKGRLDLVLQTSSVIIGIEHKMRAPLYNDLKDYSHYVDRRCDSEGLSGLKVVLSLHRKFEEQRHGFVNITHDELLDQVESRIGKYHNTADSGYLLQFLDLIRTLRNHTRMQDVNEEMISFLIENEEMINALDVERGKVHNYLNQRVMNLKGIIGDQSTPISQWVYIKTVLVHDITLADGNVIAIDCEYRKEGIVISVFVRRGTDKWSIPYLERKPFFSAYKTEGVRKVVADHHELPLATYDEEVANRLREVIEQFKEEV